MPKEKGFSAILIVTLVSIAILSIVYFFFLKQKKEAPTLENPQTSTRPNNIALPTSNNKRSNNINADEIDFPPLPEGYEWKEIIVTEESSQSNDTRVFYDNRPEKPRLEELVSGEFTTTGKIYETKIVLNELGPFEGPFEEYLYSLEEAGWLWRMKYDAFHLTGISGDGPLGSLAGYLKNIDNIAKTAIVMKNLQGSSIEYDEKTPPKLICPCTQTVTIFQSDAFDLEEKLP